MKRASPALSDLRRKLNQWRELLPWERRVLSTLFLLLPITWLTLRLFGFNRARRLAEFDFSTKSIAVEQTQILKAQRYAELTVIAAHHGLYKANCLHQSLALCRLLRHCGLPARLRIGIQQNAKPLKAHAWVVLYGVPLGRQSVAEYDVISQLTPDLETNLNLQ